MLTLLATRLAENGGKLKSPILTARPSAIDNCFSRAGRIFFALMIRGINTPAATTKITNPATIIVERFIGEPQDRICRSQSGLGSTVYDELDFFPSKGDERWPILPSKR